MVYDWFEWPVWLVFQPDSYMIQCDEIKTKVTDQLYGMKYHCDNQPWVMLDYECDTLPDTDKQQMVVEFKIGDHTVQSLTFLDSELWSLPLLYDRDNIIETIVSTYQKIVELYYYDILEVIEKNRKAAKKLEKSGNSCDYKNLYYYYYDVLHGSQPEKTVYWLKKWATVSFEGKRRLCAMYEGRFGKRYYFMKNNEMAKKIDILTHSTFFKETF